MIKTESSAIAIVAIGILSVLFVGTASLTSQIVAGQGEEIFRGKLSGKEEVPPKRVPCKRISVGQNK